MEITEAFNEVQAKTKEYHELKELLTDLPRQLHHQVMMPVSSVGFIEGQIVHSNELLMALGDGWFRTCTAFQAQEIIDRRLQVLDAERRKLEDLRRPQPKKDFEQLMGRMKELEEEEKSGSTAVSHKIQEKQHEAAPVPAPAVRVSKFKQERSLAKAN